MRKATGKGETEISWKQIGLGTGVSVITMLTMTGFGAWLLEREIMALQWGNYLAALILLVSAFLGGKTTGASLTQWKGPLLTGICFWLVLALLCLAGFGEAPKGMVPTALAIIGGTGAAILLTGGGKRSKYRVRRYRNR